MKIKALILVVTLSMITACSNDNDVTENSTATNGTDNGSPNLVNDDAALPNSDTNDGTGSGLDNDTEANTESDTVSGTNTGTDTSTATETDTTTTTETGTDTGTASETDTETGTGTNTDIDTGVDTEVDSNNNNDTTIDPNSTSSSDTDLIRLVANGTDPSSATGYWRCEFQRPDAAALPINFQFFADGGGAMTAGPTNDVLFSTRDNSTAWMVVDGTLTVQAGGDFAPINMSMIDFANDNQFMSVLNVSGRTSGTIECNRSNDVSIPDEFAANDSMLNEFLLTNPGRPFRTYWECNIVGSGGDFTRELEFFSNGIGSVDGVEMQWIITQDDYIQYISTEAPIDTITIELIDVGPSPEGGTGLYFSASHYRVNDDAVSGTVECFNRLDMPEADPDPFPVPETTQLANQLLDPSGLDTYWNCTVTGNNNQNHVLDFNSDGTGTEDGIAMTWSIITGDFIRYVRSDNGFVITIEHVVFTAGANPLDDQIYADHYRINDGPESVQGFVECQRVLSDDTDDLADKLLDPSGLDTNWNCAITGNNNQNHILDFDVNGNGTEDGIAMTWMITPDNYIRYVRSDNDNVITLEGVAFTAGTDPLDDQIYADHYRINDGPDSIQGFVECQRILTDS